MLEGIIVCPPEAYPSKRPMAQKLPWLSFSQVAELKELQGDIPRHLVIERYFRADARQCLRRL